VLTKHVAESLDIHEIMLYRWRMEMRRGQMMSKKKSIAIFALAFIYKVGLLTINPIRNRASALAVIGAPGLSNENLANSCLFHIMFGLRADRPTD
jgi:hypothetical protein